MRCRSDDQVGPPGPHERGDRPGRLHSVPPRFAGAVSPYGGEQRRSRTEEARRDRRLEDPSLWTPARCARHSGRVERARNPSDVTRSWGSNARRPEDPRYRSNRSGRLPDRTGACQRQRGLGCGPVHRPRLAVPTRGGRGAAGGPRRLCRGLLVAARRLLPRVPRRHGVRRGWLGVGVRDELAGVGRAALPLSGREGLCVLLDRLDLSVSRAPAARGERSARRSPARQLRQLQLLEGRR